MRPSSSWAAVVKDVVKADNTANREYFMVDVLFFVLC